MTLIIPVSAAPGMTLTIPVSAAPGMTLTIPVSAAPGMTLIATERVQIITFLCHQCGSWVLK